MDEVELIEEARASYDRLREAVKSLGYAAMTGDIATQDSDPVINRVDALLNGEFSDVPRALDKIYDAL